MKIGLGFDVHPFGGSGSLVLAGVEIDGPALQGHSDADAVAHAVADALLGAAGLPDLGTLFPASDEQHRGASSMAMLDDVVARVRAEGWQTGNVDVVIAAEEPRLGPYVVTMGAAIAAVLGGPVSVKAKRGEGLGAIGRAEGIAVWAIALLEPV
jgi:2-C-methyl-D-erythritol 2,4-cyclodiphosphate synthase